LPDLSNIAYIKIALKAAIISKKRRENNHI